MEKRTSSTSNSQIFFGLLVILVGIIFLLNNLDIIEIRDVWSYWPIILVLIGFTKVIHGMSTTGRIIGILFIAAGMLLLLDNLYFWGFNLGDWWPLILIIIGGSLLINTKHWRHSQSNTSMTDENPIDSDSVINLFALMGGYKRSCVSQNFRGGDINAIMGGCEIDLRQASIKNGTAVINVFSFWGGINIKVPQDWNVVVQALPILGGIEDKTRQNPINTDKQLIIKGQAIMGGVEISN